MQAKQCRCVFREDRCLWERIVQLREGRRAVPPHSAGIFSLLTHALNKLRILIRSCREMLGEDSDFPQYTPPFCKADPWA